jgi:hypothetical protein
MMERGGGRGQGLYEQVVARCDVELEFVGCYWVAPMTSEV